MVLLPRTDAGHPALATHLATLRAAGIRVLDLSPTPPPPWPGLLTAVIAALPQHP